MTRRPSYALYLTDAEIAQRLGFGEDFGKGESMRRPSSSIPPRLSFSGDGAR